MTDRRFKTRNKTDNLTDDKTLARWRKYYQNSKDYQLDRNRQYFFSRVVEWYEWFDELGKNKCEYCGYDEHPKPIDVHHLVQYEKSFGIGKFINGRQCNDENKEIVKREIDKCICLCANCHRVLHFIEANRNHSEES